MSDMKIRFYPVGNGDSSLIENDDGKHLLIDYNCPSDAKDDDEERINLEDELDERLKDKDLDVLMITHSHALDGHLKIPHLWPGQNPPATGQFQFTNLL